MQKYDCAKILKLLKKKAKALGRTPTSKEVDKDRTLPDSTTYQRCFGSFRAAVRKTGYSPKGEYSNKEMLRLFKKKAKKLGRSPTKVEIDMDSKMPSSALYYKRFGSFKKIQKKLGISRPSIFRCSNEDLIKLLKKKARELGRPPTLRDIRNDRNLPSISAYFNHFGTFQKVRELAGCPSPRLHRTYTDRELLRMIKKKIKILGRMPLAREIRDDKQMPHSATYGYRFGGWQNLLQILGFPPRKKYREQRKYRTKTGEYNIPKILSNLRKKVKRLGQLPSTTELGKDPNIPSPSALIKLFGGWRRLAKLLEVPPRPGPRLWVDNEMLRLLKMKADELGRAPTEIEVEEDKRLPGVGSYQSHFGGFIKALDKIGFASPFKFISKDNFIKQIIKFYKKYKKIPTRQEFEKSSEFPPLSILDREKLTWNQILDECKLPIHSNGIMHIVNREAEMVVKRLLTSSNLKIDDLTVKNAHSPYSFKINGKVRIHVSGATWHEREQRRSPAWQFNIPDKRGFDFMVSVGFDDGMKVEAIYVFPVDILGLNSISTPAFGKNKYSQFRLNNFRQLAEVLLSNSL
jgi:hypothetical protein